MGNKESNESAAVKRQAEGFANPMYQMLDLMVSCTSRLMCSEHIQLIRAEGFSWSCQRRR